MSENRIAEKVLGTVFAIMYSAAAAYDIHKAISSSGWRQVVLITLAILMACCANYYAKIMLGGRNDD